jgi:uncharacterized coiled-coil DUF342 family protein
MIDIKELVAIFGALAAFFIGRRSKKLDEVNKLSDAYNKFIVDAIAPLDKLTERFNKLENDFIDLQLENTKIQEIADHWKTKFDTLQKLYDALKKEFETYKKLKK